MSRYERYPAGKIHQRVSSGSGETGHRGKVVLGESRPAVITGANDYRELGQGYQEGKLGEIGKAYRPLTEVEMELARVKKENTTLKMENEILKKAAAYFAGESLPGMRP